MSPQLATLVCAIGIVGLFRLNRDRDTRASPALWLPVVWFILGGSRAVTQWLGGPRMAESPSQYLEGSQLDRAIFSALILLGLLVLATRRERTWQVLRSNAPLLLFLAYCAASVAWSDFPFVTLKRWVKALGNVTMVLVVLTELDMLSALKRLVTRSAFLLVPSSILLVYYYPELGSYYHPITGAVFYTGVATDPNLLGCLCLVLGLGLLWQVFDTVREPANRTRRLAALGVVLGLNLWLLQLTTSINALACFLLGSTLIATLSLFRQAPSGLVHLMVGGLFLLAIASYLLRDSLQGAIELLVVTLGSDVTLNGRIGLWHELLQMRTDPWLGVGFESFFLGDRLDYLWSRYWWHPNQAHNGYLELYLTLGVVGLGLFALLMTAGYRNLISRYRFEPRSGTLLLAYLVVAPFYNLTEAAFKVMSPIWIMFLLAVTAAPVLQRQPAERMPGSPVTSASVGGEPVPQL